MKIRMRRRIFGINRRENNRIPEVGEIIEVTAPVSDGWLTDAGMIYDDEADLVLAPSEMAKASYFLVDIGLGGTKIYFTLDAIHKHSPGTPIFVYDSNGDHIGVFI